MSLEDNIYYADDYIKEILCTTKSIAIVGLSDKENRPSNFAAKYLKNRCYKIIPINWYGRKIGKAKFNIKELRSKYLFTLIYCFIEKVLLNKK